MPIKIDEDGHRVGTATAQTTSPNYLEQHKPFKRLEWHEGSPYSKYMLVTTEVPSFLSAICDPRNLDLSKALNLVLNFIKYASA